MGSIRIDEPSAKVHGVKAAEDGKGVEFSGWSFRANVGAITRDADFDDFRNSVGGARNLPEQLFGGNFLEVCHLSSGIKLRLNALEALKQWHAQNLAPLLLKHAQQWRQSRAASFEAHEITNVTYDWTYTTPNNGTFEKVWNGQAAPVDNAEWAKLDAAMDKSLLLQREPILFFAEVPLYESELDDNGSSQLVAKIRVMPSCWYILQRFFLRVDGHLVRIHDLRILCDLTSKSQAVIREVLHVEGSYDELTAAGITSNPAAFASADAAAEFFQAIAPTGHRFMSTTALDIPN